MKIQPKMNVLFTCTNCLSKVISCGICRKLGLHLPITRRSITKESFNTNIIRNTKLMSSICANDISALLGSRNQSYANNANKIRIKKPAIASRLFGVCFLFISPVSSLAENTMRVRKRNPTTILNTAHSTMSNKAVFEMKSGVFFDLLSQCVKNLVGIPKRFHQ